jgi:phosphomevalonate kinase
MKTCAPGKVVLSGAYSVLEGATAIVSAVDRYVVVDTETPGNLLTDEVKAAGILRPLWFDASALRSEDRKLGLGSSAAILVATLGAAELAVHPERSRDELRQRVFRPALEAHRRAQGGGSGIDVASSCFGGILEFRRDAASPHIAKVSLPSDVVIEVWASQWAASTSALIAQVSRLADQDGPRFRQRIDAQGRAAEAAVSACRNGDGARFIAAIDEQRIALNALGEAAGVPIVTREVEALATHAGRLGAAVMPAGAGGGDIALYVGPTPSFAMDDALLAHGHRRLTLTLGAEGLHSIGAGC